MHEGVISEAQPDLADPRSVRREEFYRAMVQIRTVEQRMLDLYAEGQLSGTVHTSLGQEASAVGIVRALDAERDVIFSNHRAHGHYLAYCDDVEGLVAEILGRSTGVCAGIGGTQHLHRRNLYTNGIQGGIVPCAVGAALAEKQGRTDVVVVVFLGDGTMAQGTVYEGMNVAALWSLPVLFVLDDNGFAQSTPKAMQHAGDLRTRSESFGIPHEVADGFDVDAVHEAARRAVEAVRTSGRPFFLVVESYRLGPHSKGDDVRDPAELAEYWQRDPIAAVAATLDPVRRAAIESDVSSRVDRAVATALDAPYPTLDTLFRPGR